MGKPTGFKEFTREVPRKRLVAERVRDFSEIDKPFPDEKLMQQAARCMDCGVPFCHTGCPLGNVIPDWNDLAYRGQWKRAIEILHASNNFPEFTGRLCPAPCEEACVLGIHEPAVTIRQIEKTIIEHAFEAGWIQPLPPQTRTGKKVAVIGSGPAGLACAQQLNRAGHSVTVFERADRIGGLLRYGIPDFKLEKDVLDRRLKLMEAEGVAFRVNCEVGKDFPIERLKGFDAIVLAGGATRPRDLPIPGRDLDGIHFAMDYLPQQNRRVAGDLAVAGGGLEIAAAGKNVIVLGGGDTGADCVGTANRQRARSVTQFELLPKPPAERPANQPWPYWPMKLRKSSSHEEGVDQRWSILTKEFLGAGGHVKKLRTVNVEFLPPAGGGGPQMREIRGTEREWPADLVLLALGFLGPETDGLIAKLGVEIDPRGNVKTDESQMTNVPGVFATGDMRRGQSLIVWAISEGREAARGVDRYLMGATALPTKGEADLPRI
ncbi:MAG: glutamate synthase subunit beta [Candidatus Sumerlaeota bacterium]|nr:glutamate synthase subunit beta [Candidatus Sumerlaeota bacterium]